MILTAILFLLTALISGSHQQCFGKNDDVAAVNKGAEIYQWQMSRLRFSLTLLKTLNNQKRQGNIVFSPWSVQEVLLIAYFGAARETETSLAQILQIPANQTKPLTWTFFNSRNEQRSDEEYRRVTNPVKSANRIFLSNKLRLRQCFAQKFQSHVELIDYERDAAANYINKWVETVTEGEIRDLLQSLSTESTACLVNAVYLKSKWLYQFDAKITRKMPFHVTSVIKKTVKMMVQETVFKHSYSAELGARLVFLPYEGNRTGMVVILPDRSLDTVIAKFTEKTFVKITNLDVYKSDYFKVVIPKFEQRNKFPLETALSTLGLGKVLTRNADFSGFTGKKEVFFDKVIHQAVIRVDEEGTTAAAATGMGLYTSVNLLDFRCDRPFAYVIYDFYESKVLFMGTFRQPI